MAQFVALWAVMGAAWPLRTHKDATWGQWGWSGVHWVPYARKHNPRCEIAPNSTAPGRFVRFERCSGKFSAKKDQKWNIRLFL